MKLKGHKANFNWQAGRGMSKLLLSCTLMVLVVTFKKHSDVNSKGSSSIRPTIQTRKLTDGDASVRHLEGGLGVGDASVWRLRPGQPEEGYRRHGAAAYYYVLGAQIAVAVLALIKVMKDNNQEREEGNIDMAGCFCRTFFGWDFISTVCACVSLILLGEIAKDNFIGEPLFIWEAVGQNGLSVIATTSEAAAGDSCYQFDLEAMKEVCAQKWAEYQNCKETSSRPSRCNEDMACQMLGKEEPVIRFADNLQGWTPVVLFVAGNTLRLLYALVALIVDPEAGCDKGQSWLWGALQDGFAYTVGMYVTQLSIEDDCLQIQFLTDIHTFTWVYTNVRVIAIMLVSSLGLVACSVMCPKGCTESGPCQLIMVCAACYTFMVIIGCVLAFFYSWILLFKDIIDEPSLENILAFVFAWIGLIGSALPLCFTSGGAPYSLFYPDEPEKPDAETKEEGHEDEEEEEESEEEEDLE